MDEENSGKVQAGPDGRSPGGGARSRIAQTVPKILLLVGACLVCALTALALIRYVILPAKTWIGG
jgi:hypothetical protein